MVPSRSLANSSNHENSLQNVESLDSLHSESDSEETNTIGELGFTSCGNEEEGRRRQGGEEKDKAIRRVPV